LSSTTSILRSPHVLRQVVVRADGRRHGREHELWIPQCRELDEPDAVREGAGCFSGDLGGEPRLADSAGPGDGDEAHVLDREQVDHAARVVLAPHEGGGRHRQPDGRDGTSLVGERRDPG
jgi:hypothetical protein